MKRLLLLCSLVAISYGASFAQGQAMITPQRTVDAPDPMHASKNTPVPAKSEFIGKANELDGFIAANDNAHMQSSFDQAKKMMESVFRSEKMQAHDAASEDVKQAYRNEFHDQYAIYVEIMHLKADLAKNRNAIHDKMMEFSNKLK